MNSQPRLNRARAIVVSLAALLGAASAQAQFAMVPAPLCKPSRESQNDVEREYRIDASRHLYACFPMRVFRGRLPPLLYGVVIVETEIDTEGQVVSVQIKRPPAAPEVGPWVQALVRRASPYPVPARFPGGTVKFTEIFLVDKSGLFQTDSLTEGQN